MITPVLNSVGIEFETEYIPQDVISSSEILGGTWRTTHDGSIESQVFTIQSPYNPNLPPLTVMSTTRPTWGRISETTIGTELVSVPISTEGGDAELNSAISKLCCALQKAGEPAESYRGSIHIHIGFPYTLRATQLALRLGCWMEDVFYRLGGMGYQFRGMRVNDSLYCRPLTKWGPPVVQGKKGRVQCFVVEDMLNAKTTQEFWNMFCNTRVDNPGTPPRYVPQRYCWLNINAIPAHGTLEFRVFNKSLTPIYIQAVIEVCKKFTQYCFKQSLLPSTPITELPQHSVYDQRELPELMATFSEFAGMVDLSSVATAACLQILKRTPPVILPPGYVSSHLRQDGTQYFPTGYTPPTIPDNQIRAGVVDDIHHRTGR